ncbi:pro-neuregulin-4, membrane-bound isoform-like [Carcharodon carcharias]|uniref:pro-neuregulin-4, membrane-bound isoform-like n=1 Tax=Carcharodon carcharias TaxID=13397 RepID=UPI001B7EC7DD|nr:pro-neuregulin-4, membrane-bound isoform-like [Carcharodon carcharias]
MDHSDMVTPAHGELCPNSYNSYCLNGGTCYILTTSNPFCWCNDSFKGSRCEEFLLESQKPDRTISPSLVVTIVMTLLIALAVIIGTHFCCKKWRQRRSNQQNSSLYHIVATRGAANIREILSVRIKKQDVDCRPV